MKPHGNFLDVTGRKYGRLTATSFFGKVRGSSIWQCLCDCGAVCRVRVGNLTAGGTVSCGCARRENRKAVRHGLSKTAEYRVWLGMKQRCYSAKSINFKNYGGRGISVCERWKDDFAAFYADMGRRPSDQHSIERVDVDGDYCPENCTWLENHLQASNRRNSPKNRIERAGAPA